MALLLVIYTSSGCCLDYLLYYVIKLCFLLRGQPIPEGCKKFSPKTTVKVAATEHVGLVDQPDVPGLPCGQKVLLSGTAAPSALPVPAPSTPLPPAPSAAPPTPRQLASPAHVCATAGGAGAVVFHDLNQGLAVLCAIAKTKRQGFSLMQISGLKHALDQFNKFKKNNAANMESVAVSFKSAANLFEQTVPPSWWTDLAAAGMSLCLASAHSFLSFSLQSNVVLCLSGLVVLVTFLWPCTSPRICRSINCKADSFSPRSIADKISTFFFVLSEYMPPSSDRETLERQMLECILRIKETAKLEQLLCAVVPELVLKIQSFQHLCHDSSWR